MDIEELSKAQLILLTILVNFVTSIATAILAVTLLDHAPPYVTQTINRVVEKSVDAVAQAAPVVAQPAPSTQDLVTAAIAADAARLVSIYPASATSTTPAVAIGTFLPKSHTVVTAAQTALPREATIGFSDGSTLPASLAKAGGGIAIYGFADNATFPKVPTFSLVAAKDLALGETALAIGADGAAATGIVSKVGADGSVQTTLPQIGAGSAVVDLSGNLIGIAQGGSATATAGLLFSADAVGTLLSAPASTTPAATLTGSS
ncbi:MAG: hypothetical protein KGI78_03135 [Patescibacteria group bacterium]|nr:hypothetical protein [Patescibacteria group bacterium]MDE1944416.1 hypothetical protein [Patescibacteria group bacterium]MDE1945379.1 hypothetical protein [Patescibacteria group bacterium]MDE2057824.1 hypothetical protein [Patescibacteria group bacterium]